MFDKIFEFESQLAEFTGAPYAIMTDSCTHAIEMCLRYDNVESCSFTAFTYLSVPMTMHKLGIKYQLLDEDWIGEYQFHNTRIWDSARRLQSNMYRLGSMQCLSFGRGKPLEIGRGGAILLDDIDAYNTIIQQRSDGRDLRIKPWQDQLKFKVGYHYRPTIEEAILASQLLPSVDTTLRKVQYPDCRLITIVD